MKDALEGRRVTTSPCECARCHGTGVDPAGWPLGVKGTGSGPTCYVCEGTGKLPIGVVYAPEVGREIRDDRKRRGIGLRKEAKTLGLSASTLSEIERGVFRKKTAPSLELIITVESQRALALGRRAVLGLAETFTKVAELSRDTIDER